MRVCVPVTPHGQVDPRWGRADRVAVATVQDGEVMDWQEYDVGWSTLHGERSEGAHHARIVRFLREHEVEAVGAHHVGPGMQRMLETMKVRLVTDLEGDARAAATAAAAS
jgi:predicted Fe-Mo cluster-binding NifX family protein